MSKSKAPGAHVFSKVQVDWCDQKSSKRLKKLNYIYIYIYIICTFMIIYVYIYTHIYVCIYTHTFMCISITTYSIYIYICILLWIIMYMILYNICIICFIDMEWIIHIKSLFWNLEGLFFFYLFGGLNMAERCWKCRSSAGSNSKSWICLWQLSWHVLGR